MVQNRHVHQWSRIEDPEINPHNYTHLIFNKEAKNIHWEKTGSSLINDAGKNGSQHIEDRNYCPLSHPVQKNLFKMDQRS
jgi:hypothetical protein